jgi:ketosteroid isomerase-like protein
MYGRFTRAFVLCAISAGAVAACSSKSERAAVDSAKAAAPAADTAHVAAPAAAAPAAAASPEQDVKAAENSWRIALVSGDTVTLGKLTATEFSMPRAGHPSLSTYRKDLMSEIGSGMVQSDTSALNDLTVKANGDTAVATAQFYWKPSRMGKPAKVETESIVDTWVRKGGSWQLVSRKSATTTKK